MEERDRGVVTAFNPSKLPIPFGCTTLTHLSCIAYLHFHSPLNFLSHQIFRRIRALNAERKTKLNIYIHTQSYIHTHKYIHIVHICFSIYICVCMSTESSNLVPSSSTNLSIPIPSRSLSKPQPNSTIQGSFVTSFT